MDTLHPFVHRASETRRASGQGHCLTFGGCHRPPLLIPAWHTLALLLPASGQCVAVDCVLHLHRGPGPMELSVGVSSAF